MFNISLNTSDSKIYANMGVVKYLLKQNKQGT